MTGTEAKFSEKKKKTQDKERKSAPKCNPDRQMQEENLNYPPLKKKSLFSVFMWLSYQQ